MFEQNLDKQDHRLFFCLTYHAAAFTESSSGLFSSISDDLCRHVHFALSGMCVLVGALTTHGLGGQLRHKPLAKGLSEQASAWRFWQPFQYVCCRRRPAFAHITEHAARGR